MKFILIYGGKESLVDDEDFQILSGFKWSIDGHGYATRGIVTGPNKTTSVKMHRQIMRLIPGDGKLVDHINGNKIDNRKENLRLCTVSENARNRGPTKFNSLGLKGVKKRKNKFSANIMADGISHYLGVFDNKEDAAYAYAEASKKLHLKFSKT